MATREQPEMQLLVSVRGPADARAALIGGADVIDAKDPRRGALGAVSPVALAAIRRAVGSARPVSAALGDAGLATAWELGADVVGVRGAACIGGRLGRVAPERVATLLALARATSGPPVGALPLHPLRLS